MIEGQAGGALLDTAEDRDSHSLDVLSSSGGRAATEDDRETTFFSDQMTDMSADVPTGGDADGVSLTAPLLSGGQDATPPGSPRSQQPPSRGGGPPQPLRRMGV